MFESNKLVFDRSVFILVFLSLFINLSIRPSFLILSVPPPPATSEKPDTQAGSLYVHNQP